MTSSTKQFRENLANAFINVLSEKELDWKKNWSSGAMDRPVNAITGKGYKGLNWVSLMLNNMDAVEKGLPSDNRWATFKQINDQGWKVRRGAHGCKVEYWQPYDFKEKKPLNWKEYAEALENPDKRENVGAIAKYYVVFNGRDIEGIPELEDTKERVVVSDEIIQKISSGMGVDVKNDGNGRAFYRPSEDCIHVPLKEAFFSTYDYNCTVMHELSHATGAEHRLNRNMKNRFGSVEYAYEELVAEISSAFMGEHLQIEQTKEHLENHKAYVQSWISEIKDKPDTLVRAIRDAGNAANLLEYHAGILTKEEYQKTLQESKEVPQEQVKTNENSVEKQQGDNKTLKSLLQAEDIEGLKQAISQLEFHPETAKFDANYNVVKLQVASANQEELEIKLSFHNSYDPKMVSNTNTAIKQQIRATIYEDGNVQKLLTMESSSTKSIKKAEKNYQEVLQKWKNLTGQANIEIPVSIEADLKANGFKPTKTLVSRIKELNHLTGKEYRVKDIKSSFQEKKLQGNPEARKIESGIVKMLQNQERLRNPVPLP